eukprot:385034_1
MMAESFMRNGKFMPPSWITFPKLKDTGLHVIKHGEKIGTILLEKCYVLLGRNSQMSDIILQHPSTSRRHALIGHGSSGNIYVMDLCSSHGTFLNGVRLKKNHRMVLRNEDIIIFGQSTTKYYVKFDLNTTYNSHTKKRKINEICHDYMPINATKRMKLNKTPKTSNDLTKVSKTLSWILRHGANKINLNIGNDGFINVNQLLNTQIMKSYNIQFDDIVSIVKNDTKGRYLMKETNNKWKIRANQGHSMKFIDSDRLLIKLSNEDLKYFGDKICHGTYYKYYDEIM